MKCTVVFSSFNTPRYTHQHSFISFKIRAGHDTGWTPTSHVLPVMFDHSMMTRFVLYTYMPPPSAAVLAIALLSRMTVFRRRSSPPPCEQMPPPEANISPTMVLFWMMHDSRYSEPENCRKKAPPSCWKLLVMLTREPVKVIPFAVTFPLDCTVK